jgi:cytochrome c oxidase assembly factor CtaG
MLDPFSGWSLDGPPGLGLAVLTAGTVAVYLTAARVGRRRDRRERRWPRQRTACWLAGVAILLIDLYSPIGADADTHLADHMVEHMVMWLIVAPLLAAAAPVRLALFALAPRGRRRLGRWLRSGPVRLVTSPSGSVALFSASVLVTQLPAVYALTLRSDPIHVTEHALYLVCATLVWVPVVGADPLPHRPGPRAQATCLLACMVPMAAVSIWLLTVSSPVYADYAATLGPARALADQRLAGLIMLLCGLPAFGVPALAQLVDRRVAAGATIANASTTSGPAGPTAV